jgi:hypothetical protein
MKSWALFKQHLELKLRVVIAYCAKIGFSQSSITGKGSRVPELLVSRIEALY